ncbi:MAG: hypothetical protein AAFN77_03740 [Planctomycetota bacterium]
MKVIFTHHSTALSVCFACLVILLLGCNSISSTMLQRTTDNAGWQVGPCSQGVPITLKVPTHLKVEVREKQMLQLLQPEVDEEGFPLDDEYPEVVRIEFDRPLRAVYTDIIRTDKIFTVDPKRPAAGVLAATLDFQGQYFKQIKYKNEDKTIEAINSAIASLTSAGGLLSGVGTSDAATDLQKNVMETESVVASAIFEVDDPNFEDNLKYFLDLHLTGCHACAIEPPKIHSSEN